MFNFILGAVIGVLSTALVFTVCIVISEAREAKKKKKCKICGRTGCTCKKELSEKYLKKEIKLYGKKLQLKELKDKLEK